MPIRHYIVATAGHVDHGKSALVRALTGTDPDRLPEEKTRGITIDLGFAHLQLPAAPESGGDTFDVGLVDVPGHEDFVQNMVAGVGAVNLALFVVAADDLWMPQTEEHLQILSYLDVRRAVVALTKIDLTADEPRARNEIRRHLQNSVFQDAPIVATSAPNGRGIEELKTALAVALAGTPAPRDIGKPRLQVDRVFTLRGIGTVVTGTLTGGTLQRGQRVAVQPSGRAGHIRSVQNHHQEVASSAPGTRTALNLPDFAATGDAALRRGDVLALPDAGQPSRALDVLLERSARHSGPGAARTLPALKTGARVRLHLGSGHWNARLTLLDGGPLAPGQQAIGRLRVKTPIFAFAGDRFIVRDGAERTTLAGGVVLDPDGLRPLRRPAQRRFLSARADAVDDCLAAVAAVVARDRAIHRLDLLVKSNFTRDEIDAAVILLQGKRVLTAAGEFVADAAWWLALRATAAAGIDAHHVAHPEKLGLPLAELRLLLARELPHPELFGPLVADLAAAGFIQGGTAIRRVTHQPALPAAFREAGARIRATLRAQALEPPSRQELAPDAASQQALRFLRDTGEVIELSADVFLLAGTFLRTRAAILRFIRSTGPATASDLRQMLGTTRRVLIPLLERLDQEGVTRREGDRRVLREKPAGL